MNSLTWLLTPRSRASSLGPPSTSASTSSSTSATAAAADGQAGDAKGKGKEQAKAELAHGPREEESEAVDELLGDLERSRGRAAANLAERKASMSKDGTVRLGLPGITERRRVKGLELALDGGDRQSELAEPDEGREDVDRDRDKEPAPPPVDAPPSPVLKDHAALADDPSPPPPPPPPSPPPPPLVVEKRSRVRVASLPVRWSVKLYLLVRRFLSLFGLGQPEPAELDEKAPLLRIDAPQERWRTRGWLFRHAAAAPPLETVDEQSANGDSTWKRRPRWRTDSMSSSSDPGTESDSSARSRGSWFSVLFSPSRAGTPSRQLEPVDEKTKAVSGKKLEALLKRPKTLVLDLDETLIHSTSRLGGLGGGSATAGGWGSASAGGLKVRVIEVVLDGRIVVYHVYKRPWVDFFLKKVSSWYTVVIFTASLREYADPVIDWLDAGRGIVGGRLFRESCTNLGGSYVKDLAIIDPDLSQVCLVDNSPVSYGLNQANGIPIEGWLNDPHDEGLLDLLPMLDSLRFTNDVRRVLGLRGFSGPAPTAGTPGSRGKALAAAARRR